MQTAPTSKPKPNPGSVYRFLSRQLAWRIHTCARALGKLDPKAIERSTIAGISLFAASSIALQGFVVAKDSFSGSSSGVAQAAAAIPSKSQVLEGVDDVFVSSRGVARADLDMAALVRARRGDLLTGRTEELEALDRKSASQARPRLAAIVPADTVVAKTLAAAGIGFRFKTLAPETRRLGNNNSTVIALSNRLTRNDSVGGAGAPRPMRVAYSAAALGDFARQLSEDRGGSNNVAPPARRRVTQFSGHASNSFVKKVHFQEHTPDRCLPNRLMAVINDVAEQFGDVQILSTFRDPERNRRVGGAPRSYHLRCEAIDFRVKGHTSGLLSYLEQREEVGGLKRYPLGFFHIDTGPRRTW